MSAAREIRNKIKSIDSTRKITGAMELVSISKIKRCQDKMEMLRPYKQTIIELIGHMACTYSSHPAFIFNGNAEKVGYVVLGTDRGLCGGLNINLFKNWIKHMKEQNYQVGSVSAITFGRKALAFSKSNNIKVLGHAPAVETPDIEDIMAQVRQILDAYLDKQIGKVFLVSNDFVNTMTQRPEIIQLLPLVPVGLKRNYVWTYKYEPSLQDVQVNLIRRYIESVIYEALLENVACEQASRMVAMKSATENASEMIHEMNQLFNRQRQAAITQEIAEIISGSNAIS